MALFQPAPPADAAMEKCKGPGLGVSDKFNGRWGVAARPDTEHATCRMMRMPSVLTPSAPSLHHRSTCTLVRRQPIDTLPCLCTRLARAVPACSPLQLSAVTLPTAQAASRFRVQNAHYAILVLSSFFLRRLFPCSRHVCLGFLAPVRGAGS